MVGGVSKLIVFVSDGGQDTVRWKDVKDMDDDPDQVSS